MTIDAIRERIKDVCEAAPLQLRQSQTPFSFELEPDHTIDQSYRIEVGEGTRQGLYNYGDRREDAVQVEIARTYDADPEATYRDLLTDAETLQGKVIRDGTASDYFVSDDGRSVTLERQDGASWAFVRVVLPVNYEITF